MQLPQMFCNFSTLRLSRLYYDYTTTNPELTRLKTMPQNLTFEHDPYSRKATRYLLWLQVGAILVVLGLIALRAHGLAFGV